MLQAHNTEVEFYELMAGLEEHFKLPRVFFKQPRDDVQAGAIIMEDLSVRGVAKTPVQALSPDSVLQVHLYLHNTFFNKKFTP